MPRERRTPSSATDSQGDDKRAAGAGRKHPVLLAIAVVALVSWLGFLAFLAVGG